MQLLLEHSQHGKVFRLGAKYELSEQKHTLVERYGIKRFVLVEGDQRAEWNLALKLAGVVALVLFAILLSIAMEHFGPVAFVSALPIPIFVFPIAAFLIYRRIRETITVEDILEGRHFSCRSIVTLLEKKQQISEMGEKLRAFCSFSRIGEDGRSLRWRLTGRQLPGLWRGPRQPNKSPNALGERFPIMEWWQLKEGYLKPIGGLLLLPYVLYKEIREQTDLWKAKGHSRAGDWSETWELRALVDRLSHYREEAPRKREALVQGVIQKVFIDRSSPGAVAATRLVSDMIDYEDLLSVPDIDLRGRTLSTSEIWETSAALMRALHSFEKPEALAERLEGLLRTIWVSGNDRRGRR